MAVLLPGKFIYLATPHTASCATTEALGMQLDNAIATHISNVMRKAKHVFPGAGRTHHHTHQQMLDLYPEMFQGTEITCTTIRHPCDLIVTWWLRQRDVIAAGLHRPILFPEFVRTCDEKTPGPYLRDGKIFWQQADVYLRYETLQQDLNEFLTNLGLPHVTLKPVNVTADKRDWRTYYDDQTIAVVVERFGKEAQEFGYEITHEHRQNIQS